MANSTDWTTKEISTLWAFGCGGGVDFIHEGRFIVAKKQHADGALKRHGVKNVAMWYRHDIEGTDVAVFIQCPYDEEAMSWRPDYLAKQRAYQEALNRVLEEGPKKKAPRKRKGGRS